MIDPLDHLEILDWENARVSYISITHEHGALTISIGFEGPSGAQAFGGRNLNNPKALHNFVEGVLAVTSLTETGQVIRVGRDRNGRLAAIRPLIEKYPIFCPGNDPARDWLFQK